jgi:outer membrane lipopolysaccharide assembly protein LptE/RlpB
MKLLARVGIALLLLLAALCAGCGYHTLGSAQGLPPDVKVLAVPIFINQTHSYHVETALTEAVIREFNTRTRFRVVHSTEDGDAVLHGTVVSVQSAPVAYDSKTGRASTGLVTITAKVTLVARDGRVLYSNSNLVFRDQYQISNELASFFEEQGPAQDRLARDFARTLVSNLLEAF